MRIEHNGQWTDVPKECLAGVSFDVNGLALSGNEAGLVIVVVGTRVGGDDRLETGVYKSRDDVTCYRVVPCPNVENPNHERIECEKDLLAPRGDE